MLTIISKEVLEQIFNNLTRCDIYQLLCVSNYIYLTGLHYPYVRLELGYHIYICQLKNGILKKSIFKRYSFKRQ